MLDPENVKFPELTPTVKKLLVFLVLAFVAVTSAEVAGFGLVPLLSLNLTFGQPSAWMGLAWQPLTYWFVYPAQTDELLNVGAVVVMAYFFMSPFERVFGASRTLILCALGILCGAAACLVLAQLYPAVRPFYGGGVLVAAAFGTFPVIFKDAKVLLLFMIPMSAWTALGVGVAAMGFLAVINRDPFIFAADLAATLAGIGYARYLVGAPRRETRRKKKKKRRGGPDLRVIEGGSDDDRPRWLN